MGGLVMIGAGHAHLAALRRWAGPPPVVICPEPQAVYSGLVPAVLRREIPRSAATMDVAAAIARAGGIWIAGRAAALDLARRQVRLADGRDVPFATLSIDIGGGGAPEGAIPVRPVDRLVAGVIALDGRADAIAIAGAGAVGTELALALAQRWPGRDIVLASDGPVLAHAPSPVRRRATRALVAAGVTLLPWRMPAAQDGRALFWAAGAVAPPLLANSGLSLDADGFARIDETLRSLSHPCVFVAGDAAAIGRPKSGAWAVAAGRVLARNLALVANGREPASWRKPRHALAIMGLGGGLALAWRGEAWIAGRAAHWLKQRLDENWMRTLR